jgi:phosphatidylserine/phosphatidylglycerophosphate/cardiolipin synthase-like enzyme
VTPLLTPDTFLEPVLAMIERARNEILLQNQTFNAPTDRQPELASLIDALIRKQQQGVKLRIIIRKFMASKDRQNLEALVDRGLSLGSVRFQANSHTKGLIIDRKEVLLGSQNWSQSGVTLNRDASLLFEDVPMAEYFAKIFDHDWRVLATPKIGSEALNGRIAGPQERTPNGYVRIRAADLLNPD